MTRNVLSQSHTHSKPRIYDDDDDAAHGIICYNGLCVTHQRQVKHLSINNTWQLILYILFTMMASFTERQAHRDSFRYSYKYI